VPLERGDRTSHAHLDQFGVAADGVERRSKLMRHRGQKLHFRAIRVLRLRARRTLRRQKMRALERLAALLRERDEEFALISFELVRFGKSNRQRAERLPASVEWENSGGMLRREFPDGRSVSRVPLFGRCQEDWLAAQRLAHGVRRVGWYFLKDYQRQRLVTFLDPSGDPRGAGYQVIQSKIAVGDGGVWGRGVTRGTQTQLRFLPATHTDLIFSSFAEEHGFVGVVVALGLYFLLLMQIVQNAQMAPDRAGMYVCMGVAALLLFHVLVNVGMVVGRMPVTGIPLPLMSSGGSNMFSVFMMLGLVNSVRLRRFVN